MKSPIMLLSIDGNAINGAWFTEIEWGFILTISLIGVVKIVAAKASQFN